MSDVRLGDVEKAVREAASRRPIRLILPCHADDIGRPALARILEELSEADWLAEVLVPLNGFASSASVAAVSRETFRRLARPFRLLWCDGPEADSIRGRAARAGLFAPGASVTGKGWNVWLALGVALTGAPAGRDDGVLAVHDADIVNYRHEMLLRLCAPIVHPNLGYEFAKGYYRRVTEGVMFGRVTRLLVAPLLRAAIRVAGHHPLLDYLAAFRYPLAGECACTTGVARDLPMAAGWGLEIGLLCEIHRRLPPSRICQVELGPNYEHKHRPLRGTSGRAASGLIGMARDIARELVGQLRAEGIGLDRAALEALGATYRKTAAEAVERHAHDAVLNGLKHDEARERDTVEAFAEALRESIDDGPAVALALPAWSRVFAAAPDLAEDMRALIVDN